jgi:hypothetical protein
MTFITNRVSIPLPVGKPNQTKTRQGAASLQRILVAVVTCVVGMVLACVIAAAVFHDSSRAHQDLQDRAVLSLDLVSLPARRRGVASGQEPRQSPVSGLATNDDFVCATIFGLDEKVVDHASTKLDQRTPTAADLKLLTTAMGETLPPARRLDLRFDRAIAFVQPLYADDGRTIATLFARFSTERAIAEYMRGIVYDALGGLLVLVTVALLLYVLVARVTAPWRS